jgi:predicted transcriptional regulator
MANRVTVSDMPNSAYIKDAEVLGKLIKAKRTKLNMKLADCAALCGVGINTLSRIENGSAIYFNSRTFYSRSNQVQ